MMLPWFMSLVFLLAAPAQTAKHIYALAEKSTFTVEVHTGSEDAKSSFGSGYLVTPGGHIVTNYHVVRDYIERPNRYKIRVKNKKKSYPAELVAFNLSDDIALIKVDGLRSPPLKLSPITEPAMGTEVVAMGNPYGLRLSIIEGIFNGYAEKGLIDRMFLSMPLNSGMSGGPILNQQGEVIGTNVSVFRKSNSVSFGVPLSKALPLLGQKPLKKSRKAYLLETKKQLIDFEKATFTKVYQALTSIGQNNLLTIGGAKVRRFPKLFDCWNNTEDQKEKQMGINWLIYNCNLDFTPSLGRTLVGYIDFSVEYLASQHSSYGFYGYLSTDAEQLHDVEKSDTEEGLYTGPECRSDRVMTNGLTWLVNTCVQSYVDYEDLHNFALSAVSLDRPKEAIILSLKMNSFKLPSFQKISEHLFSNVRFSH
jgi:serine protease Do